MSETLFQTNKTLNRPVDQEQELKLYRTLTWIGLAAACLLVCISFYFPYLRELEALQTKQLELEQQLASYNNYTQAEEIPGPEMLPQILDQYRQKLQQQGLEVISINVEKFVSNTPQTGLGYALVRVQLKYDSIFADRLYRLELVEGQRQIIEEIKIDHSETRLRLKVYFSSQ